MTWKFGRRAWVLLTLPVWLLVASPARAARLTIDDITANRIKIIWSGFEAGFSVNDDANKTEDGEVVVQGEGPVTFAGGWNASGGAGSGGGGLNLLEPGTVVDDSGAISDILSISWSVTMNFNGRFLGDMTGSFQSGGNLGDGMGIVEMADFQSVGYQSDVDVLGKPDHLFIEVASEPHPVPEPSTLALLATGLAGAWRARRRP